MASVSKLVVLEVNEKEAKVRHLTGPEEWWPLASLPPGMHVGDLVRVTEHGGNVKVEIEWIGTAHPA